MTRDEQLQWYSDILHGCGRVAGFLRLRGVAAAFEEGSSQLFHAACRAAVGSPPLALRLLDESNNQDVLDLDYDYDYRKTPMVGLAAQCEQARLDDLHALYSALTTEQLIEHARAGVDVLEQREKLLGFDYLAKCSA